MIALAAISGLAVLLAFANGANDVSKGIATLVGSGVSSFRRAVLWGAAWTVAGAILAAFASQRLVATFSGNGFLGRPIAGPAFPAAVATGALAWVLFASRTGLPVSTTHAIAGALAGAGALAQGAAALHWAFLAKRVALPLALSPLLAIALVSAVFPLLSRAAARVESYCLCVERRAVILDTGLLALQSERAAAIVAPRADCETPAVSLHLPLVDALHWLSSALTSLARGLNDAPKIVALAVAGSALFGASGLPFYVAVAAGIGAGSLLGGFRVTKTLANDVTRMSPAEGFAANIVTTVLVGLASWFALPVSTTHVSSGSIVGIGLHRGARSLHRRTLYDLLLAWLVTLPVAALVGAASFAVYARL